MEFKIGDIVYPVSEPWVSQEIVDTRMQKLGKDMVQYIRLAGNPIYFYSIHYKLKQYEKTIRQPLQIHDWHEMPESKQAENL